MPGSPLRQKGDFASELSCLLSLAKKSLPILSLGSNDGMAGRGLKMSPGLGFVVMVVIRVVMMMMMIMLEVRMRMRMMKMLEVRMMMMGMMKMMLEVRMMKVKLEGKTKVINVMLE